MRISTWVGTVLQSMMLITAVSTSVTVSADNVWVGGASDGNFSSAANWQATPSWSFSNSLYFNSNSNAPSLIFDVGQPVANDIIYQSTFTVARTLQPSAADQVLYFKTRLENQSTATLTCPHERTVLYAFRQRPMSTFASRSVSKTSRSNSSSRSSPLKLSTYPFCQGDPGSM